MRFGFDVARLHFDELDSAAAQAARVRADLLRAALAGQHPEEGGGEAVDRFPLHEHDAVFGCELAPQPVCGDDAARPASEHDNRVSGHLPSSRR